jgi:outer membrane lipoprotein
MKKQHIIIILIMLTLSACATSSPFDLKGVNRSLSPALAKAGTEHLGQTALWGGLIIQSTNLKDRSEIEVLSYPLNEQGEPIRSASAQGRFYIQQDGYLETAQYAAGRWVSVLGTVKPSVTGKVGSADYTFAVIKSVQLELWPDPSQSGDSNPRVQFGIGIGISR